MNIIPSLVKLCSHLMLNCFAFFACLFHEEILSKSIMINLDEWKMT